MDPFDLYSGINLYGNQGNQVNPYNSNPLMIPAPGQQQPGGGPRIPPFSPEEEESILSKIGGGALKGLGYVGSSLSKAFGGRAIRGLLGGHLDELASIIPFSDTMGITDPNRDVRGSDLLGGNKDTPFLSPEGIGGFGLDVLTDPGSWLLPGAKTAAGLAAEKAGTLAPTFMKQLAAGERGLIGVRGVPVVGDAAKVYGAGQGGVDFLNAVSQGAAKIPGAGIAQAAYNNVLAPAGRQLGALFDTTVNEATSTQGRVFGRQMTADRAAADVASRQVAIDAAKAMGAQGTDEGYQSLRRFMELGGEAPPEIQSAAGIIKPELERMRLRLQDLGLPGYGNELDDIIGYMPRYKTPLAKETGGFGKRQMLPTQDSRLAGREDILKDFVEGTEGVNKLTSNKELYDRLQTDPNLLGAADEIRRAHLGWDAGTQDEMYALRNAMNAGEVSPRTAAIPETGTLPGVPSYPTPEGQKLELLERQYKNSIRQADLVKNLDPKVIERGGMFLNNPLEDFAQHSAAVNRVIAGGEATMDMLAKNASEIGKVASGKSVPLSDVLDRVFGEGGKATANSKLQMIQRLGLKSPEELFNMQVPASVAADAGKFLKAYTSPEGVEQALRIYDSMTNLTKAGQTSLWPALHARNAITGIWQNFVTNAFDPRYGALNPMRYIQPFVDAWKMRSAGAVLDDAGKLPIFKGLGLSDAEATQKVMELASAHGLLDRGNVFSEVIGSAEGAQKTIRLPGEGAVGLKQKLAAGTWNPLDIAGVGGVAGVGKSNATQFIPGVVGQHFGEAVDHTNRLSAFIAKLRQGFEPSAASAEAKLAHFDYSALTPFERSVMRRVIPFYNWMSNNIPFTIRQLAEQPGGKVGLALKASGEAQGRTGGFLPDSVASGLALPIMEDKAAGTKTFLSHTGLPFEDVADYASGTDYLRNLNPLIKAPIELATGHQFETGRRLADLYQFPTGNTAVNELLANSPVGRAVSTFRTAIDERKNVGERALNMLTGLHDTTVDMPKATTIAARNYIEDALSGNPHFRSSIDLQPRPDALADLSPQEVALLRLRATLDAQARQQSSQARRIGVASPGGG